MAKERHEGGAKQISTPIAVASSITELSSCSDRSSAPL